MKHVFCTAAGWEMTDFLRYANFAKGTFYLCATVIMVSFSYIALTQWQGLWSGGFKDFRSISAAIVELEKTARPVSDIAPHIYTQMDIMNNSIAEMQKSVRRMDTAVTGIHASVYGMSYTVPQGMYTLRNKMNPWSWMSPFD